MRVVVIGGTGHIGTYLVPQLVLQGHEVVVLSRGQRDPYQEHGAWQRARIVKVDRQAEDAAGTFGSTVAGLEPDVVIDLICFTEDSARQLAEALRGARPAPAALRHDLGPRRQPDGADDRGLAATPDR